MSLRTIAGTGRRRCPRFGRARIATLCAVTALSGCGGSEPAGKAAYERGFNAAREEFSKRARALPTPPASAPAEERAAAGERVAAEIEAFVADLERLDPPREVARAHADLAAAFRESGKLTEEAARAVREGDGRRLREISEALSDRSAVDRRAEDAVQVLVEKDYVLDLDFELGR